MRLLFALLFALSFFSVEQFFEPCFQRFIHNLIAFFVGISNANKGH